jgi:hypothetical protein
VIKNVFWLLVSPISNRVEAYLNNLYDEYVESLRDIASEWDDPWP